MNYILSLQEQLKELKAKESASTATLNELRAYLFSDKFRSGDLRGYVSIYDVDRYILRALYP